MESLTDGMRDLAVKIAWKLYGLPYIWGGDDSVAGFDCSGMCIEVLKSVGLLPREGDWTADGLYRKFIQTQVHETQPGCLVFWGNANRMTHVEMIISGVFTIGASGGGSRTQSRDDAIRQNAYIKIRPIGGRGEPRAIVDPFAGMVL